MSAPDLGIDDAGRQRREEAVARVGDALDEARSAAEVAGAPDAFGLLCAFFPALVDPAQQQARAVVERGAAACRRVVGDLRAAGEAFAAVDDAGAGSLRSSRPP